MAACGTQKTGCCSQWLESFKDKMGCQTPGGTGHDDCCRSYSIGTKIAIGVAVVAAAVTLAALLAFLVPAVAVFLAPVAGMGAALFALAGINATSFGVMIGAGIVTGASLITAVVVEYAVKRKNDYQPIETP